MSPLSDDVAAATLAAIDLLDRAAGTAGFVAAVGDDHYESVWTRDAAICCLGVLSTGDDRWHPVVARTLTTLARRASPLGQLPNTVWAGNEAGPGWWDFGEHGAVDPTLWWCVATSAALKVGVDVDATGLGEALRWLRHQDTGGTGLVQQSGATDWMDSSIRRSGTTLHDNALWVMALTGAESLGIPTGPGPDAAAVGRALDLLLWPSPDTDPADALWYLPQHLRAKGLPHPASVAAHVAAIDPERDHWASHRSWGHVVDVVDVLGNCLAVLADLADHERRSTVLDGLIRRGVADPFPSRTLGTPVVADGDDLMLDVVADAHQGARWRNPSWRYHNAASWPFVGGFHALAVRASGDEAGADRLAAGVARAVREGDRWTFPEWRDGRTGEPGPTRQQAWSAAGVLLSTA